MTASSENPGKCNLSLTVNGELRTICVYPMERLLDVMRHELNLTGTKEGCGQGECGSCAVLMNGELVNSCLVPALQAAGTNITTIEGFADSPQLNALQASFLECGGAQCGICTPGMILASCHLLNKKASAHPGRNPRRPRRESLPLHRIQTDFRCRRDGRPPQESRMRSNPADYELVAPENLQAVVSLLADQPGQWLPIAGGTDVMVQYAAGNLAARKLVSIGNLPELRAIEILPDEIRVGAGATYTDLREHEMIAREFPLLAIAASWTGGIANQVESWKPWAATSSTPRQQPIRYQRCSPTKQN